MTLKAILLVSPLLLLCLKMTLLSVPLSALVGYLFVLAKPQWLAAQYLWNLQAQMVSPASRLLFSALGWIVFFAILVLGLISTVGMSFSCLFLVCFDVECVLVA